MKIGVLTSSRADFGIYQPLLELMSKDDVVDLHIITFGMHLSSAHGMTVEQVESKKFGVVHRVSGLDGGDSIHDIVKQYGETIIAFAEFWTNHDFDLVFTLGDRFEMNAAVQSTIPFNIPLAHLHGGEKTLGAIDEIYRHQITLASTLHFTSTAEYAEKVRSLLPDCKDVFDVGALSLDNLNFDDLPSWESVRAAFGIPDKRFILITFHPETVDVSQNASHLNTLRIFFRNFVHDYHLVVTLANADTMGQEYRNLFFELEKEFPDRFTLVESFGRENYFTSMKASEFLLGNTSSGIIEAASAGKYVINVGNRQEGRTRSENVIDIGFDFDQLHSAITKVSSLGQYRGSNVYRKENTAQTIITKVKSHHERL